MNQNPECGVIGWKFNLKINKSSIQAIQLETELADTTFFGLIEPRLKFLIPEGNRWGVNEWIGSQ